LGIQVVAVFLNCSRELRLISFAATRYRWKVKCVLARAQPKFNADGAGERYHGKALELSYIFERPLEGCTVNNL
jgi:hypothetical protein